MTAPQRTRGKWILAREVRDLDPEGHLDGGFYSRSIANDGGVGIAEVYWHGEDSDAETIANGELLAAAPDLYAALESFPLDSLRDGYADRVKAWYRERAQPALGRARGEAAS